jgi:hypothetical protein
MKKLMIAFFVTIGLIGIAMLSACSPSGSSGSSSSGGSSSAGGESGGKTPAGNPVLNNEQLSAVAPGLGTLMMEIGNRNWALYYAAKAGNWQLAAYEAKEIGEACEAGSITRPKRKAGLDSFTSDTLAALNKDIAAKDSEAFKTDWSAEVDACNRCHDAEGFSYIKWKLPSSPPEGWEFSAGSSGASSTP